MQLETQEIIDELNDIIRNIDVGDQVTSFEEQKVFLTFGIYYTRERVSWN